jgi:hypothetical protein
MTIMPRPSPATPAAGGHPPRQSRVVCARQQGAAHSDQGEFGTPEFDAEYQAAVSGRLKTTRGLASGSLSWLFERYRETPAWLNLSLETRKQREAIIAQIIGTAGDQPYVKITRATIIADAIGGSQRRRSRATSSRQCADYLGGQLRRPW